MNILGGIECARSEILYIRSYFSQTFPEILSLSLFLPSKFLLLPFPPFGNYFINLNLKIGQTQHFASKLNDEDKDEIELLFSIASQFVESSPTSSSATIAPSTISETVQILNKLLPSLKGEVSFLPFPL